MSTISQLVKSVSSLNCIQSRRALVRAVARMFVRG